MNVFGRLLPAHYSDGVFKPPRAKSGKKLPNARALSLLIFDEQDNPDPELTLANMQWGNIVAHDLSHAAGSRQSKPHYIRCCTEDGVLIHDQKENPRCFPIVIPPNDPVLKGECMNLVRTETDRHHHCPKKYGPVEQVSAVTAFMDLSLVYGNSEQQLSQMRAFRYGHMLVEERKGQTFPPHHPNTTETCDVNRENDVCYLTGDVRANSSPGITALHILLLREHNRIADELTYLNPHWEDEYLFQEARRINIAQYQYINYYEWLPLTLG
jgi:peroxidase